MRAVGWHDPRLLVAPGQALILKPTPWEPWRSRQVHPAGEREKAGTGAAGMSPLGCALPVTPTIGDAVDDTTAPHSCTF